MILINDHDIDDFFWIYLLKPHTNRTRLLARGILMSHFAWLNVGLTQQSGLIEAPRLNQVCFSPCYAEKAPRRRKITEGTPLCFVNVLVDDSYSFVCMQNKKQRPYFVLLGQFNRDC